MYCYSKLMTDHKQNFARHRLKVLVLFWGMIFCVAQTGGEGGGGGQRIYGKTTWSRVFFFFFLIFLCILCVPLQAFCLVLRVESATQSDIAVCDVSVQRCTVCHCPSDTTSYPRLRTATPRPCGTCQQIHFLFLSPSFIPLFGQYFRGRRKTPFVRIVTLCSDI